MDTTPITAQSRSAHGKGAARKLRASGLVPAVIYRGGQPPVSIALDGRELTFLIHKSGNPNLVLDIQVGDEHHTAIVKDAQKHPISRNLLHIDFYKVDPDLEVVVEVPIRSHGKAPGFQFGGMLITLRYTVGIRCKPGAIPDGIDIDISSMEIGDFIRVSSLIPPEGCAFDFKHDYNVLSMVGRRIAIEEEPEEGEEGEEGAEAGDEATEGEA
jgi:large subunit ribosomal protein L25